MSALEVLGVSFSDRLDFSEHFRVVCARVSKSIYVLKVLKAHGLLGTISGRFAGLPTSATSLTQHLLNWWGYTDASSRLRLQAVIKRLRRFGLLPREFPTHEELCEHMCGELFMQMLHNKFHVLHQLLPRRKRHHMRYVQVPIRNHQIIPRAVWADNKFRRNFIIRMPYKP